MQVTLVLGERQKKLPTELVTRLLSFHSQVTLIETNATGHNALDLVIAYHIGRCSKSETEGRYHIVSKDKDFDALIKHLKTTGVSAARHAEFALIPILNPPLPPHEERMKLIKDLLLANAKNRPTRLKTLRSHINAKFGKRLTESELDSTVKDLISKKMIKVTETNQVVYSANSP